MNLDQNDSIFVKRWWEVDDSCTGSPATSALGLDSGLQ